MGQRRGAPPLGVPRQSAVGPQRIRAVSVFANPTNAVGLGLLPQANGVRSIKRAGVVVRDEEVVGSKLSARRMGRLTRLLNGRRVGGCPLRANRRASHGPAPYLSPIETARSLGAFVSVVSERATAVDRLMNVMHRRRSERWSQNLSG